MNRLDEIEARLTAATPGEWERYADGRGVMSDYIQARMMCPVCGEWSIDLLAEGPLPTEGDFSFKVGRCLEGCRYRPAHAPAMMTILRAVAAQQQAVVAVEEDDGQD